MNFQIQIHSNTEILQRAKYNTNIVFEIHIKYKYVALKYKSNTNTHIHHYASDIKNYSFHQIKGNSMQQCNVFN